MTTAEPDWTALKRARADAIESFIQEMCDKHGWDRGLVSYAAPNPSDCCCDCANGGPCQHRWAGPYSISEGGGSVSITCSLCGMPDLRCAP